MPRDPYLSMFEDGIALYLLRLAEHVSQENLENFQGLILRGCLHAMREGHPAWPGGAPEESIEGGNFCSAGKMGQRGNAVRRDLCSGRQGNLQIADGLKPLEGVHERGAAHAGRPQSELIQP